MNNPGKNEKWYAFDRETVLKRLKSERSGLKSDDVKNRLLTFGYNELPEHIAKGIDFKKAQGLIRIPYMSQVQARIIPTTADWFILDAIRYPAEATNKSKLIWNSIEGNISDIVNYNSSSHLNKSYEQSYNRYT